MTNNHYNIDEKKIMPYLVCLGGDKYMRQVKADLKELNEKYNLAFLGLSCPEREKEVEELTLKFNKLKGEVLIAGEENILYYEEHINDLSTSELQKEVHYKEEREGEPGWQKKMAFEKVVFFCAESKENADKWYWLETDLKNELANKLLDRGKEIERINKRLHKLKKYMPNYS